jgi:hypothetical protein
MPRHAEPMIRSLEEAIRTGGTGGDSCEPGARARARSPGRTGVCTGLSLRLQQDPRALAIIPAALPVAAVSGHVALVLHMAGVGRNQAADDCERLRRQAHGKGHEVN